MGAWIETLVVRKTFRTLKVAPFMGAWIETKLFGSCPIWRGESHPSWVRGLKHRCSYLLETACVVAPFMGAWIETPMFVSIRNCLRRRTLHGCVD